MESVSRAAVPADTVEGSIWTARLSDELLARQAARGSERAFAVLYERYHQPLYRYCRSILRNDADAQDALQSTFAGALSALRREKRSAPLRPWLFRIAHNESIAVIRRRARDTSQELPDGALNAGSSAEDEAAERARWGLLVADLAELPERARSALLLRELSGLSHQEIAIALETTVGGAKQAIFEARQALFELAEGRAMRCEEVRSRISAGDRRVLRGRGVRAHLRDCAACEQFAASIRTRQEELRAYAPVLAPAASAALLQRALGGAAGHGGGVATSSAVGASAASSPVATSAAAGAAGKAAGAAIASKVLAAVAVVATAGAGVAGVSTLVSRHHAPPPAAHSTAAGGSSHTGARGAGHSSAAAGVGNRSAAAQSGSHKGRHGAGGVAGGRSAHGRHLHRAAGAAAGSHGASSAGSHSNSSSRAGGVAGSNSSSSRGSSVAQRRATGHTRHTGKVASRPTHGSSSSSSAGGLTLALPLTTSHSLHVK
jgi:RNA polymerase sigma factor (sigma-70 family)